MTTVDSKAEAYRLARVAMKSTGYVEDFGEDGIRDLARIVVDAIWEQTNHLLDDMRETILQDRTDLKMQVRELEAELAQSHDQHGEVCQRLIAAEEQLAQSQAEVKLRGEYAHDLFRELQAERVLADSLGAVVQLYVSPDDQGPGGHALAEWRQVRSSAQGEEPRTPEEWAEWSRWSGAQGEDS